MKENKFYILEQPKHAIFSVIIVDLPGDKELPEEIHEKLNEIAENTDLFFLFTKPDKKLNKFSALYKACGYVELEENSLQQLLLNTLEYDQEIFHSHTTVSICNLSESNNYNCEKIIKLAGADICKPVFERKRLSSIEFWEIYKNKKEKFYKQISSTENMYMSYGSSSPIILLKPPGIKTIIMSSKTEEGQKIVDTFKIQDFKYFIASYISLLGIDFLNVDISKEPL